MLRKKIQTFLTDDNPIYDQYAIKHQAKTNKQKTFYILMHILPGFLAFLGYQAIEPVVKSVGITYQHAQLIILLFMSVGWEIILTFFLLNRVEKLNFKESLRFLGFTKPKLKGLFVVLPLLTILFIIIMVPFKRYLYTPLFDFFNGIPLFRIPDWHLFKIGYYDFPASILVIAFIGNFIGEEIYFRGYLLKKIRGMKGDWIISSILFQIYHLWQLPINWPFILIAPFVPFASLTKLNKNIYAAIIFHVLADMVLFGVIAAIIGILP